MKKSIFKKTMFSLLFMAVVSTVSFLSMNNNASATEEITITKRSPAENLYNGLNVQAKGLSAEAFEYGIKGYTNLLGSGKLKNDSVISIIDFSLSSDKKRLFVIDLKNHQILFNTYVSHGKNSGVENADAFSNERDSYKSSLGFYITSGTYLGKHGYSLRLEGEEKGINDNALSRGIVMHGASYVNEDFVKQRGYIGRSQGCPAIPEAIHKEIIQKIKDGSCLFIYSPDQFYITHSSIINPVKSSA